MYWGVEINTIVFEKFKVIQDTVLLFEFIINELWRFDQRQLTSFFSLLQRDKSSGAVTITGIGVGGVDKVICNPLTDDSSLDSSELVNELFEFLEKSGVANCPLLYSEMILKRISITIDDICNIEVHLIFHNRE